MPDVTDIADVKIIGKVRDYSYPQELLEFFPHARIHETGSNEQLYKMLNTHRVDAAIFDINNYNDIKNALNYNPDFPLNWGSEIPFRNSSFVSPLYPILKHDTSEKFLSLFNNALQKAYETGVIDRIQNKYGLKCPQIIKKDGGFLKE